MIKTVMCDTMYYYSHDCMKSYLNIQSGIQSIRECDCESNNDFCITCMCIDVITVTSDGPSTQHHSLHGHIPCILVGTT